MQQLVFQQQIHSSDDEHVERGGSRPGRNINMHRKVSLPTQQLLDDYFSGTPLFDEECFCHICRMHLFLYILNVACDFDDCSI